MHGHGWQDLENFHLLLGSPFVFIQWKKTTTHLKFLGNVWLKTDFLRAVIQLQLPGILKHLLSNLFPFFSGHL